MPYATPPTGLSTLIFGGAKLIKKFIDWLNPLIIVLTAGTLGTKSPFLVDSIKKRMRK